MENSLYMLHVRERIFQRCFHVILRLGKIKNRSIRFDVVTRWSECYYWKECRPRQQGGAIFMAGDGWCARHKKLSRTRGRRPRRISM